MGQTTLIRGRPLRTLRLFGSVVFIGEALIAAWIWRSGAPGRLHALPFLFAIGMLIVAIMVIATAMARVTVDDTQIQFSLAGIQTRTIALASITGYQRLLGRGSLRILCGSSSYCPNGLLDHDQIARELERRGIRQVEF